MNTAPPLAATLAQIHRLSLDGTTRQAPDAIREVSSLIQSEVFKWPEANSVTPRVMELCQRLNLIARELDAADLTIAHPSRGVVDEAKRDPSHSWPAVDRVLLDAYAAGTDGMEFDLIAARKKLQAAALPAVPDGWQPIETAPKDNARLLLLARSNPDTNELQELDFDGIWQSESESWELPQVYWYWASARGIEDPTHWMYQPAAPAQED